MEMGNGEHAENECEEEGAGTKHGGAEAEPGGAFALQFSNRKGREEWQREQGGQNELDGVAGEA